MEHTGIILLTSTGLSNKHVYEEFKKIRNIRAFKKAVIITTASFDKEKNIYSKLAFSQLKDSGIENIDFYDFEDNGFKDLSSYDVVYVCGGNTFKLLKFSKQAFFDSIVRSLLERGGMYIGVSAGSLILGPSIQIANEVHPDKNEMRIVDFTGLNIIDLVIFPHYSLDLEKDIQSFEKRNNIKVDRISNNQAIMIEKGNKVLVE